MLFPEIVTIDDSSGEVSPSTGSYAKRLADMEGLYRDPEAWQARLRERGDEVVYEVREHRREGSDLFFGTTTMASGKVGQEYFMTRGHYHARADMGEVYWTRSGRGLLVLETRSGEARILDMVPGGCAFIPPGWAHRSVNTGGESLVFVWVCSQAAGNDYADILGSGMRTLVVEKDGQPVAVPNPSHPSRSFPDR